MTTVSTKKKEKKQVRRFLMEPFLETLEGPFVPISAY